MEAQPYRLIYEVGRAAPAWPFVVLGLFFVAVATVLWRYRHRLGGGAGELPPESRLLRTAFAGLFLFFSVGWTAVAVVAVFGGHRRAVEVLERGEARVVEGPVEQFHPMPPSGHALEHFVVGGVYFEYSDFVVTDGFHQTQGHGGPIREGLQVRIHYADPPERATILKLEVKD